MTPAIEPEELVVAIRLPPRAAGTGACFLEFARRHGDFAIVAVAVLLAPGAGGRIAQARVALGGVGPAPLRLTEAEAVLQGALPSPELFARATETTRALDPMEDALVPAWYRRHLAGVLLGRALATAHERMARA
jgi:carbon-monoxide dehydrogenase medium subunit